jgi:hypothetical protein
MKNPNKRSVVILVTLLTLLACLPLASRGIQESDSALTEAAGTILAQFTLAAGETAIAELTQIVKGSGASPTLPRKQATLTETPTPQPSPTSTPAPTATPLPPAPQIPCDQAQFVQDVTVPTGSTFPPGSPFVKTWRVVNSGTCTWNSNYALVYSSGDQMGTVTTFFLPGTVAPGQSVDISANLVAPAAPGFYQEGWALRNPSGELFGFGPAGNPFLQVQIYVVQPASVSIYGYDFAVNYCEAEWRSASGALNCPGLAQDPDGAVILVQSPLLESRQALGYGLWTVPNDQVDGWISGYYPFFSVNFNDHFLAEIGCLQDSPGCDVIFELDYMTLNGAIRKLDSWPKTFSGTSLPVDVDLSPLAGQQVRFILTVLNDGDPLQANAFWLTPRILNGAPQPNLVLTWNREGYPQPSDCNELDVYILGDQRGEARAYDCSLGNVELGRAFLSNADVERVRTWRNQLQDFDSQIYSASPAQPVVTWIYFYGSGSTTSQQTDIDAINSFATSIYTQIVSNSSVR